MSIQFIHGDCLEEMKKLEDKSIDCFICDLPYGCLTRTKTTPEMEEKYGKGRRNTYENCSWDIKIDLVKFWGEVERLMRNDHVPVIMFCNMRFGLELYNSKPNWFRYDLVWNKQRGVSFLSANKQPLRSHENIFVFAKKGAFYKRVDIEGEYPATRRGKGTKQSNVYGVPYKDEYYKPDTSTTHRCPLSVINVQTKALKGQHPTAKPVELYKWILERYCPSGGTVLDPTAGSFNSCFAGASLDLEMIGIEKEKSFYDVAVSKFLPFVKDKTTLSQSVDVPQLDDQEKI